MKLRNIRSTLAPHVQNRFIATEVTPLTAWVNGKPTDEIVGWKVNAVCPSANYDNISVKIESDRAPLNPDEVAANPVEVTFEGLEFTFYLGQVSHRLEVAAKAVGVKKLNDNK